jgi:signal transduction histidine kinase
MRNSLRIRLLAGAAIAIFFALGVAWFAMTFLFQRQIEARVEQELNRYAIQLIAGIEAGADGALTIQQPPLDPRFETPASGLYWQITGGGDSERSRSLWDHTLAFDPFAVATEWQSKFIDGPFGNRLFLLERLIQIGDAPGPLLIQVAIDEREIVDASAEFGRVLALFLLLLWCVLSGAAWFQVQLGLRPLSHLRKDLATLRLNAAERLSGDYPDEVEPLTAAINDLATARETDLRRARQRAADLAHGMKTPLAALSAQSRLIREGKADAATMANGLDKAIAAAAAAVEAELARARAAANRHTRQEMRVSPLPVTERLISVLEHTEKGMRVDYELQLPDRLRLSMAEDDLTEILGPLLENAVRFARRVVRVSGKAVGKGVHLSVEDDGPGMNERDAADAMARGSRLDEVGGGHGLGLAIARELVEATGGAIALGASSLGGLQVDLRWEGGASS